MRNDLRKTVSHWYRVVCCCAVILKNRIDPLSADSEKERKGKELIVPGKGKSRSLET